MPNGQWLLSNGRWCSQGGCSFGDKYVNYFEYYVNMEQVQFRGIDTTLDHDEVNNDALSHDEIARAENDMAEKGNSDPDGSGNNRGSSRQVHDEQDTHKTPRGSSEMRHMFDIVLLPTWGMSWQIFISVIPTNLVHNCVKKNPTR